VAGWTRRPHLRIGALSDTAGQAKNREALVTLGPIRGNGRRAEVGTDLWNNGRAAFWLTYDVQQRGNTWAVNGTTGPVSIAKGDWRNGLRCTRRGGGFARRRTPTSGP
jgi:hypothetical protein